MDGIVKGWIGVDFDGTLAAIPSLAPIPKMVNRVVKWLAQGKDVRILTARYPQDEKLVREWIKRHIGQDMPITNAKKHDMLELWDDRAVQVIPNTGVRADGR